MSVAVLFLYKDGCVILICCFQKRSHSFREADKKVVGKEMGIFEGYNEGNAGYVRFEVCTAVTIKNDVFWDIKPSSYSTGDTLPLCYRVQPVNSM
jgi:hypothetical protein